MILTPRQMKKITDYENSLKRFSYDVGVLYRVEPPFQERDITAYCIAQPRELGYTRDYCLDVGSLILCVESGYYCEQPYYPGGGRWPIDNFNGLRQGNLFLHNNHLFFISHAYTYYDQRILLVELEIPNDIY